MGDVEMDWRNIDVKRWTIRSLGRSEWAYVMRKVKAKLKGL